MKEGDKVRYIGQGNPFKTELTIKKIDIFNEEVQVEENDNWYAVDDLELISQTRSDKEITIYKPNNNNNMNRLINFVKTLTLSKEEKLLRKHGLKTENGDYTTDAKEVVINTLCAEKEPDLIKIAEGLEAQEKEEAKKD